ncbi:MAG TPA: 4-(cytidine 5'-diphospho)-2-C-methyl-D-erythritol kinase [Allosphingosinicella sp.]|jgi:4-diphosphocytidyl-2-C-methyl-D-erythritol kinase
MRETAYAKLNLALHVRSREPDGYHRIETLFAFCEHGDTLSAAAADELSLEITGPYAAALGDPAGNLVLKAADALRRCHGVTLGAALTLDKRLPVASGIGGGSADAAGALRLLGRLWHIGAAEDELIPLPASLGADVPACLASRTLRGEGRGDRLLPVDAAGLAGMPVLLVNPGVPLSTAQVFAAWDGVDRGPLADLPPLVAARQGRNDLEAPAKALAPAIGEVLERLGESDGLILARMSGSGATCFALFESERQRDAASARLAASSPGWWRLASRLR